MASMCDFRSSGQVLVLFLSMCLTTIVVGDAQVLFYENFNANSSFPTGWSVYDEDDQKGSDGYQSIFTAINSPINPSSGGKSIWLPVLWSDYRVSSATLSATSRFDSKATANDWIVSPPILLGASSFLTWDARASSPYTNSDGYEVRISGGPIDPITNTGNILFSTDHEVSDHFVQRLVDLTGTSFANQTVYLAWRTKGENGNLLWIDNIKVIEGSQNYADVSIGRSSDAYYQILPFGQKSNFQPNAKITNTGLLPVTNAEFSLQIFDSNLQAVFSSVSNQVSILNVGATITLSSASTWLPASKGKYLMQYVVSISENDQLASNDTFVEFFILDDSILAMDNGIIAGEIGLSGSGAIGKEITIGSKDILTSVSASINVDSFSSVGNIITAGIYMLYNDTPVFRIAGTEPYLITDTGEVVIQMPIAGGPISLDLGSYLFVIDLSESMKEALIHFTDEPELTSYNWGTLNYLDWFHLSDKGFNVSSIIRPVFNDNYECMAPQNPAVISVGTASALLSWNPVNEAIGYELSGHYGGADPSTYIAILRTGQANTEFLLRNLCTEQTYDWRIRSICSFDGAIEYSDYSPIQSFTTKHCAAVGQIATTNITSSSAMLTWAYVPGAIGYRIVGQAQSGALTSIIIPGAGTTSLQVNNLPSGTNFIWQVQTGCALKTPCSNGLPVLSTPLVSSFATLPIPNQKANLLDKDWQERKITLFPNPTTSRVYIDFDTIIPDRVEAQIEIYSMDGKLQFETSIWAVPNVPSDITVNNLSNGVYQMLIKSDDHISVEKLVISK